jgi:hypothetical protein
MAAGSTCEKEGGLMRYYVAIRAWRQGEFEAAVEEVKRNNPVGVSIFSSSFDPLYKKQSKGYMLEAESKEEAIAEAKVLYAKDGFPPESEWGDLALAQATHIPYLTIRELLAAPVLKSDFGLGGDPPIVDDIDHRLIEEEGRVRTDYLADLYIDGERGWRLCIVYFDGKPAYVSQDAGRGGRDFQNTYLISRSVKADLVAYLRTRLLHPEPEEEEWPLDKETVELTCFYSHSLGNILEKKLEQHD